MVLMASVVSRMDLLRIGHVLVLADVVFELDHQDRGLRDVELSSALLDDDPVSSDLHELARLSDLCSVEAARCR